ncbi:MAG: hypothetical protein KY443_08700, partial [Actinobacteria bacterium]|nr:hypothetical protein [Actinomycetota bacterium]
EVRPEAFEHTVVILVGRVHRGVLKALSYAKSLRPDHLAAVYVSFEDADREDLQRQWEAYNIDVPLEIVHSPYRDLVEPVERYLDELDARWHNDTITVIIPEFVMGKLYDFRNLLHNQSAFALKAALLGREGTVVTSVPYHVDSAARAGRKPDGSGD